MFIVIFKRDIYCGAIGFISPEEIIFSVPIRILQKKNNEKDLKAYCNGDLVSIDQVNDEVFSKKMMGDGIAIKPSDCEIYAPCDATVTVVFESTNHAVGLTTEDFGGFCKDLKEDSTDEYIYGLRYEEFIAINTAKIKQLEQKIKELEATINSQME